MAASLNSSWGANPRFNAATFAVGHLETGDTPFLPVSFPTEENKKAPEVDKQILAELHDNLFLVDTTTFIRKFMYGQASDPNAVDDGTATSLSSLERRARDEELAEQCLEALKDQDKNQAFQAVIQELSLDGMGPLSDLKERISPYQSKKFTKLDEGVNSEHDFYDPLADLFSFIAHFFRYYFNPKTAGTWTLDIDESWPSAVNPGESSQQPTTFRRRRFVNTHNKTFGFSQYTLEKAELRPDLALILCEKPQGAWPEPTKPRWKDVKVPIEVKLSDGFDADRVCQMARYARATRLEQFDRNFTFSLLISKNKCRVFHWDASRCHVAEVDIHENPAVFIQIIARLASMDPQSMGYDPRFSNSGRVISTDKPLMSTWLEVTPTHPTKFHELSSKVDKEGKEPLILDLFIKHPIFQARGFVFSRFTRVWEGREVAGPNAQKGKLRVVKQNWADASRINEAFLYEEAKDVPNVARLMCYENVTGTVDTRSLWNAAEILGVYRIGADKQQPLPQFKTTRNSLGFNLYPCDESPRAFMRVLVRMIFEEKGRSILGADHCRELLEATKQWVRGIFGLNEKGIIHRDVSSGNLLLGHDSNSPAFLIDLGLAHWSPPNEEDTSTSEAEADRTAKAHHHLTGTLPFIALDLLEAMESNVIIKHEVHHDLESVFWVLLYVVLLDEPSLRLKAVLDRLLATKVATVAREKRALLGGILHPDSTDRGAVQLTGRYKDLARFLGTFASACWDQFNGRQNLDVDDIISWIDHTLLTLPPGSGEKTEPSKRSREPGAGQEEQVDGASHKRSGNHAKKICSGQGVRAPVSK